MVRWGSAQPQTGGLLRTPAVIVGLESHLWWGYEVGRLEAQFVSIIASKTYDMVLSMVDHAESGRNRASSCDPDGLPAGSSPDLTCASSLCKPGFLGKSSSIGGTAPSASAPPSWMMKGDTPRPEQQKDTLDDCTRTKGPTGGHRLLPLSRSKRKRKGKKNARPPQARGYSSHSPNLRAKERARLNASQSMGTVLRNAASHLPKMAQGMRPRHSGAHDTGLPRPPPLVSPIRTSPPPGPR